MANSKVSFIAEINKGYNFQSDCITIGASMFEKSVVSEAIVKIPLKTMNRHGLISGATGTGKTKSLQLLAENLSNASVPVLLLDIKGDLSGIGAEGKVSDASLARATAAGLAFKPQAFPVELMTISTQNGLRLRATITEFGPILLAKILELNDTQEGIVAVLFKYCDDKLLPLIDLKDFIKVLQYVSDEGKDDFQSSYGQVASSSFGTILRKVIELQQQGADLFFGEKSFDINDLMRIDNLGRGFINIVRVNDIQEKPKLFSTFMLSLLAELYANLPEAGDLDRPKLVIFIDEAHLIFEEASDALLKQIETIIRLIRSKGVGIYFCTQNPKDVPASVLGQLGLKIQHALRAFTAVDRQAIKLASQNYPLTDFYDTEQVITELGIGEALVTVLNEKGIPAPLVQTLMCSPSSRMDILTETEISNLIGKSKIAGIYNEIIDRESAFEILSKKLEMATEDSEEVQKKEEKSTFEKILESPITKQVGRTAASIITRSLLGAIGIGGKSKKSSWF